MIALAATAATAWCDADDCRHRQDGGWWMQCVVQTDIDDAAVRKL